MLFLNKKRGLVLVPLIVVASSFWTKATTAHEHQHQNHAHHHHHGHPRSLQDDSFECGTSDPSSGEMRSVQSRLENFENIGRQRNSIPTYWHSIRTSSGSGGISSQMITNSINHMNSVFSSAGFSFNLVRTTTTDNDSYYTALGGSSAERNMKRALRQGGANALNVYSNGIADVGGVLGYATFPWWYEGDPLEDGIVVDYRVTTGGSTNYRDGDVVIHEIGHWLGLYHVFQGGCSGNGDFVDDTPPQRTATSGCPSGQDSCSGGGADSINNFMDYSSDACMTRFTSGQITRMGSAFAAYRAPSTPPSPPSPTSPTSPPPAPAPAPGSDACFSSHATVQVQDKGPVEMPDLRIGDKVLTANGYQTIYSFAHQDSQSSTEFLQIHTTGADGGGNPLEISPQHLVFVKGKPYPIPAHSIQVGDVLLQTKKTTNSPGGDKGTIAEVVVKEVASIYHRKGLYAPLTTTGTLVVDGIISSCYVSLQEKSAVGGNFELRGDITVDLSQHFMAHLALAPIRMICVGGISPKLCKAHDGDGLAYFVKVGLDFARFADSLSLPIQVMLLVVFLVVFGSLYAVECIVGPEMAVAVFVLLICTTLAARIKAMSGAGRGGKREQRVDYQLTDSVKGSK